MTARPVDAGLLGMCALAAAIAGFVLAGPFQFLTGDEPRYLMYAASIWKNGTFLMDLPDWQSLYFSATHTRTTSLPMGANGVVLLNGVYLPSLLAPVAGLFSLAGLRASALFAGLTGLFYLFRLCRRASNRNAALLATAVAGLSIPLLPYLHLFYMEAFLFALVCCGWDRLQTERRSLGGEALTALVILLIPFVHMRGSVVAAALYLMLLWQLYRGGMPRRAAALALLAVTALGLLVALNLAIYGAVAGPVNSARPPLPWDLFPVLAMQLFNVRHGLFAYAPVWALGYAGLWIGAIRGPAVARQALTLATVAAVTGIGINPGECWPARFWVLSVPMLAVGFCIWWNVERRLLPRLVGMGLAAFTLVNTYLFVSSPNDFLENRQTAATYQWLFNKTGHVHFGLALPVEVDDAPDRDAARNLALGSGAFVLLMTLSALWRRMACSIAALMLLVAALDLARVGIVPASEYRATFQPRRLGIAFDPPMRSGYVQFGDYWQAWYAPPDWLKFHVVTTAVDAGEMERMLDANQVVAVSDPAPVRSIAIESPDGLDIGSQTSRRLVVYRSRSLLRLLVRWFAGTMAA